jgi:membrane-bound ClpP family serine protease
MIPSNETAKPIPNEPYSLQVHRKESFWQITFPIILASVLLLAFLVLVIVFSGGFGEKLTSFGAAAAVFVILPQFLGLLIWLAILIALAFGVNVLKNKLPGQGALLLDFLQSIQIGSQKVSNQIAQPSIKIALVIAQFKQILASFQERMR